MSIDVVIVSAARTPVGSFLGALSSLPASKLGEVAIRAALERAGVTPEEVDEVILGHVLQAAAGQGPARQAAMGAGIRKEAPAWSLNQICGSGLRAVAIGAQQIALGDARIVVAAEDHDAVLVVDRATRAVQKRITVAQGPSHLILNGNIAVVTSRYGHVVSVVDIAAGAVTKTVQVGRGPSVTSMRSSIGTYWGCKRS